MKRIITFIAVAVMLADGTVRGGSCDFAFRNAGAEISSIVVNEGYIYNLASPKTVEAGQYLFVRNQAFLPSFRYVVHYELWDGKNIITPTNRPLAADKTGYSVKGAVVREYAKPIEELNKPYCIKGKSGYKYETVTPYQEKYISYDGYEILIIYREKPTVG